MITKTEVREAIARCEPHAGFATIDNALVHPGAISRGDLFALIEAARCARYEIVDGYLNSAASTSGAVLDYQDRPDRDYAQDDDSHSPSRNQGQDD